MADFYQLKDRVRESTQNALPQDPSSGPYVMRQAYSAQVAITTHVVPDGSWNGASVMDQGNDGRFPDDSPVEIRYPQTRNEEQGDRSAWPWLPGSILEQCGPDEWYVCVQIRELAVLRDGRQAT
jgi:hypothetical protein